MPVMPKAKSVDPVVIALLQTPEVQQRVRAKMKTLSSGCVLWTGGRAGGRYGAFSLANPKVTLSAHKAVFIMEMGRDVLPGLELAHRCDNDWCVEFDHLDEKTHKANLQDRFDRNRYPTRYKTRVLTDEQVKAIRNKWKPRVYSQETLAKEYGVSRSVVQGIIERTKYKDVP